MLQKTRIVLHQNWPITITFVLLLLFVIASITFQHWDEIFATKYYPTRDELVDYWGIVRHSKASDIVILPPLLWIAMYIANSKWVFKKNGTRLQRFVAASLLVMLAIPVLFVSFIIIATASLTDGTRLNHLESISYNEHNYYLALADTTASGADAFYSEFFVYKCEDSGYECYLIRDYEPDCSYTNDCASEMEAHLRVTEGKLYLVVDQEKVLLITS